MRVLVSGNLANMGFEITAALRRKKVDSTLLLPKYPLQSQDPKTMYPELEKNGYPDWTVRYDNHKKGGLDDWKFQIIKEMRKKNYDIIIALTEFPIFAMLSGKPYAALSTGSDMRSLIFKKSFKGFLLKLSYKKANVILWSEPDKLPLLEKLKISKKSVFLPIPRQSNIFQQKIEKGNLKGKFVIFHPVSQNWMEKRNDVFLRAFNKLCEINNDVHLIMSNRGPDIERAKEILFSGKGKDKFELVPFLGTDKLQFYYNLSDVIVDQFFVGSFGMITVEAMKCAKPVLLKLYDEFFTKCYGSIPEGIINVDAEEAIFRELKKLVLDERMRLDLGQTNKDWIQRTFDPDVLAERYVNICKEVLRKNSKNN